MNKLLFLFALLSVVRCPITVAQNWQAQEVLSLSGSSVGGKAGSLQVAYSNDRNEELSWAYAIVEGKDVTYYVLDDDLSVKKQFRISGIIDSNCAVEGFEFLGVDSRYMIASKDVFTKDGKWCVTIKQTNPDTYSRKYLLYNEDGNFVGELPSGEYGGEVMFSRVFDRGGDVYYHVTTKSDGEKDGEKVYKFTGSSGVSAPLGKEKSNTFPNPLPADEPLTISLSQPAGENTYINLIDMQGRVVYSSIAEKAAEKVVVPGGTLPRGMLIYTVTYSDGMTDSGKICVE